MALRCLQILFLILVASTITFQAEACPKVGPPVSIVYAVGPYHREDRTRSIIDAQRLAENERLTTPINHFLDAISELSDRIVDMRNRDSKYCYDGTLFKWASADALLLTGEGAQPHYVQQWAAVTLGLARLKTGPLTAPDQDRVVSSWMRKLARTVSRFHRGDGGPGRNNHYYWAMLGIGAIGLSTGDHELWDRALAMDKIALHDIRPDGTLQNELIRGNRATRYHAAAALPMAVLQLLRSDCWGKIYTANEYGQEESRLHTLIDLIRGEVNGKKYIESITRIKQLPISKQHWLSLWDSVNIKQPQEASPKFSRSLAGSLSRLATVISSGCPLAPH